MRNVFQQPFNRVVGIRAFVNVARALHRLVRPHVFEFSFGHPAAADVLIHDDEAFFGKQRGGADIGAITIGAIGRDAVRRPVQEDRIRPGVVFRNINSGVEAHAVAHTDVLFMLGVVCFDVFESLRPQRAAERRREDNSEDRPDYPPALHRFLPGRFSACTRGITRVGHRDTEAQKCFWEVTMAPCL